MSTQVESQVSELITPAIEQAGLYLDSVKATPAGKRTRLVVVLDADTDEALNLDKVAEVSREISQVLDEADVVPGTYVLEVTTPGVERPLTLPRHWHRAKGRLVAIRLHDESEITGRVVASDDTAVTLEVNPGKIGKDAAVSTSEIPMNEIKRATVEVEFNRK